MRIPPDHLRCTALARWSGNGTSRCRNRGYGQGQLCTSHHLHGSRPKHRETELVAELAICRIGGGKSIRVQLRRGYDDEEFVAVRLHVGEIPTRRALYLKPADLDGFARAISDAADRLEEVG